MPHASAAEIGAIADAIDTYRSRVAGLAEPLAGKAEAEDLLGALYEAERALRTAHRALRRGISLAR